MSKIKVLIVDDSLVIRKLLEKIISSDGELQVVGTACDAYEAREKLVELKPDVMTLDVEMPKMDGISFLEKVMQHFPTRTIVLSSLGSEGTENYFRALAAGAIEVLQKPDIKDASRLDEASREITTSIKRVFKSNLPMKTNSAELTKKTPPPDSIKTNKVLAIASSTGGTEALKILLGQFSGDIPATVIVQHMPPGFTKSFAEHLNKVMPFEVKEAQEGDEIKQGRVLIAPGNFHLEIKKMGAKLVATLHQDKPLHSVRPAADYLLKSVAKYTNGNSIGAILTGMGKDGAEGLMEMKKTGSYILAQDEKSCVVYGMPQAAINIGAVDKILTLENMALEIIFQLKKKSAA